MIAAKVRGSAAVPQPLAPGTVTWVDAVPLLVFDEPLIALRRRLTWSMGLDAHAAVDNAIAAIGAREPLLVVGPRGLDADAIIASLGTVARVDLDRDRFTAAHAERLFTTWDARPVFRAVSGSHARRVLDTYTERVRLLRLVPLAFRSADIGPMLDVLWHELGAAQGVQALGPETLDAVTRYTWPGNLASLRRHAATLLAYHRHGRNISATARALGTSRAALQAHLDRIGVRRRE